MDKGALNHRLRIVAALGTTQTLAWASSYYLAAIIADPMARAFGTQASAIVVLCLVLVRALLWMAGARDVTLVR